MYPPDQVLERIGAESTRVHRLKTPEGGEPKRRLIAPLSASLEACRLAHLPQTARRAIAKRARDPLRSRNFAEVTAGYQKLSARHLSEIISTDP